MRSIAKTIKASLSLICLLLVSPIMSEAGNVIKLHTRGGKIKVAEFKASNYRIEGLPNGQTIEVGTHKKGEEKDYEVPTNGVVTITGNVEMLQIIGGNIQKADLSQAPKSLTRFVLISTQTDEIDLSGATELTQLNIRNQNFKHVDLSKQNKVTFMRLGQLGVNNSFTLRKVIMPNPSAVETLDISDTSVGDDIGISNLPRLKNLLASSSRLSEVVLSDNPNLEQVWVRRCSGLKRVELTNCTNLKTLVLNSSGANVIKIANAPQLKDWNNAKKTGLALFSEGDNTASPSLKELELTGTGVENITEPSFSILGNLEVLNVSNNQIKQINGAFFPKVRRINITQNKIKGEAMLQFIQTLRTITDGANAEIDATANTKEENVLSTEAKRLAEQKGWKVNINVNSIESITARPMVYPTDATDFINVESATPTTVRLYTMGGSLAFETTIGEGVSQIDLSALAKGVYILTAGSLKQRISLR